jgi:transposase-like protein
MKQWLERPITKEYSYVFIDGMRVKIRDGYLKEQVVIFALGMDEELKTELLGYIVADTESEQAVRSLVIDLRKRGLKTPKLFISDESAGIEAALKLEYPHVLRQICAFHKMKNIQEHLEDKKNRKAILADASDIYEQSTSVRGALKMLKEFRRKWIRKEPEATKCFCARFEKTLRYFSFPKEHWKSLYTSNPIESFISQIRNWTRKFNYSEPKANLDLALFTYFYSKHGDLVLNMNSQAATDENGIPTLLVT